MQLLDETGNFPRTKKLIKQVSLINTISSQEFAEVMVALNSEFYPMLTQPSTKGRIKEYNTTSLADWKQKDRRIKSLLGNYEVYHDVEAVNDIHKHFSKRRLFSDVFIHGSVATNEVCQFSDINCIVVLERSVVFDTEKLLRAQNVITNGRIYLDAFNVWNHHGYGVLNEIDLDYYRESYLPSIVLKESLNLCERPLRVRIIPESKENKKVQHARLLRYFDAIKKHPWHNEYYLGHMLDLALMLPSLFLADKGIRCSKKESFVLIDHYLSNDDRKLLKDIEQARLDWPYNKLMSYENRRNLIRTVNPLVWKGLVKYRNGTEGHDFVFASARRLQKNNGELVHNILKFTRIMERSCKS